MQREKVIVIGGSGFIGRELCRLAVALGHEVVSISLEGKPEIDELEEPWVVGVEWRQDDIERSSEIDLEGAFSIILCTPPLVMDRFHKRVLKNDIPRVVLVCLPGFRKSEFDHYDASYIRVNPPSTVVDDQTWTIQSTDTIHVSSLGMALLRLGLEADVPSELGGQDLLDFGDVMMIQ